MMLCIFLVAVISIALSFKITQRSVNRSNIVISNGKFSQFGERDVMTFSTPELVGTALCSQFIINAKEDIASRHSFYVAIPGGSAVKLLKYLKPYKNEIDWSKVHLFYVNHKCVPDDDESATHFKARSIFLDHLGSVNVYVPDAAIPDPAKRAASYQSLLRAVVPQKNELPLFDLVILGMGKDGHIGSLYPGRAEVNEAVALVVSVNKKSPESVSLTLPVFNNAREMRVVVTGADKAEAVATAVHRRKSPQDFPVCGLRERSLWLLDEACASLL